MPFQFNCPQGHLLEAEPHQAGQQVQCPVCQSLLVIPQPAAPSGDAPPMSLFPPGPSEQAAPPAPSVAPSEMFANITQAPAPFNPAEISAPHLLHIPCPSGHELEVPPDMIGQDVMCPHCSVQFRLRERDSTEYKRRKKEAQELKDFKAGKAWLAWAVVFAVIVLIGLIVMIVASST